MGQIDKNIKEWDKKVQNLKQKGQIKQKETDSTKIGKNPKMGDTKFQLMYGALQVDN